jgi:hypothetical protein
MRIITFLLLVFLPLISCKKEKPSYASVKKSLLNDVESFTGFEESRYLVSDYIELLRKTLVIDLKDKKAVQLWWDDYHKAHRCLDMIYKYNYYDKSYNDGAHDLLMRKIRKTILKDNFMNFSYLMSNVYSNTRSVNLGDNKELYDNLCEIPLKKFSNFQVRYVLNSNHASFRKFNKFKKRKYMKQYKELYDRVEKIRKTKKSNSTL